jgi:glutaredoxin
MDIMVQKIETGDEYGVDKGLVAMFLKMSPEERLRSNDNAVRAILELRSAFRSQKISKCRCQYTTYHISLMANGGEFMKGKPMSVPTVKIYSLSTCSHCKSTKKMLSDCTIQYDFVDVDTFEGEERAAILEDVKKINPKCSFPTVIIGNTVIVGFKEKEIKEALGLE